MSDSSKQPSSELLTLAQDYLSKLETHIGSVTKSVNDAEKMHEYFLQRKRELEFSRSQRFVLLLKALVPFIPIVFLVGLFLLPCGIQWDGFGMKFSTATCVMKK